MNGPSSMTVGRIMTTIRGKLVIFPSSHLPYESITLGGSKRVETSQLIQKKVVGTAASASRKGGTRGYPSRTVAEGSQKDEFNLSASHNIHK